MVTTDAAAGAVPRCPVPGHEGSKVVLGGRYGTPGRRRQLYVCNMPKPGSTSPYHRFSAPLTVPIPAPADAPDDRADAALAEAPEELRTARKYQFTAYDIASGLVSVARGASYAQAGQEVRERAVRRWAGADRGRRHGTLVSDWVEVYASALWQAQAPYQDTWPGTVFVGVLALPAVRQGRTAPASGLAFSVFLAMAHDERGTPVVFDVMVSSGTGAAHWTEFLRGLARSRPGRPARIVGDGSAALTHAVRVVWPQERESAAVALWHDEHLMRQEARRICRDHGLDRRGTPLWSALQRAWRSRADWDRFTAEAARHRLPELDRWLARTAPVMERQLAARTPDAPTSRQMVRGTLDRLETRLTARRSAFGNRTRTGLLLRLMALDLSGLARAHGWADLICVWLERTGGRPTTSQRQIADRSGPSLRTRSASARRDT
ncbi:hypothetical protein [Streptomyces sp. NPDC050560]|uniref:hypothetical protein n=1 Tax=Streptomyces sp. NPDC050560 TaxID=3365630 RepID=UPI0037B86A1B